MEMVRVSRSGARLIQLCAHNCHKLTICHIYKSLLQGTQL